jgi:putative (di)nucleoside polyphosphate hydrolase
MLLDRDGRVFVGQRNDTPGGHWQMPQGGIDEGETPRQAAQRELEEEVGTAKAEIIAEGREWHSYDLPADLIPKVWRGRYRGQKQKWFVLRFLGQDGDIDVATQNPEFTAWKWVEIEQLPTLIIPFKRPIYQRLVEEFRHLADGRERE